MSEHRIKFRKECESCKGTGLYVGLAERDGSAVVCHGCKGKGFQDASIVYRDFEGRKVRVDVRRVVEVNPGICIGTGGEKRFKLEDFGGMSYAAWRNGKPFPPGSENRKFTCPAWWYQSADYERKPRWDECRGGAFSDCPSFEQKARCWERWDREFGATKKGEGR